VRTVFCQPSEAAAEVLLGERRGSGISDFTKQLLQIQEGAQSVRKAGDEITERIARFEAWLAKLPGRVEARAELWSRCDQPVTRYLALRRDGKDWTLILITEDDDGDPLGPLITDKTLLRDASLVEKVAAVNLFPDLLAAIAKAQSELATRVLKATEDFDQLAAQLGIKEGK
jgi:hypothetical protein